ncbi:L-galactose dehydrogenase isoform X2 [Dendroctonus ponderosae]
MSLPETYVHGFHDEALVREMPWHPLGNTGMQVSRIALGAGGFSYFYGDYDIEECKRTIYEAIKNGVNFIDTAPWYGHGESEKVLGQCLQGIPREAYYVATKVGRYEKEVAKMFDFSVERTRRSINESLERLKLNYVDLLQVHDVEFAPSMDVVLNETLPTVKEIVNSGKAEHIGITGYPVGVLKECIEKSKVPIETVLSYCRSTMIDYTLNEYLPFFKSKGIGVINAAVNSMGLLTNNGPPGWHPATDSIKDVCKEASDYCKDRDVELGKLAVYHGLNNSDVVLIGMNNRKLLEYNLDVLKNGINEKEQKVYDDVLQILAKLPANSQWENVELERFRKPQI